MITVQLLGGATLRSGETPISGPPAQRHRIALLTLVVAAWPQPLARDRAMALLWPEKDTTSARRLLNLAVHVLRAALGEGVIASTGDALLFSPSRVRSDLHDLRMAIRRTTSRPSSSRTRGPAGRVPSRRLDRVRVLAGGTATRARSRVHRRAPRARAASGARGGRARAVGTCRRLVVADPPRASTHSR